ncbi:hypothetical protein B296_00050782 [Ensete ventricosum]|uniref:Uncharacterized protein n=1 Tax=Ensete ventricosum TaxID=4639 RepID=A0A426WW06_ENSVE|nr:hypothetical protein B296_00050782 [Ensete ventricosum]
MNLGELRGRPKVTSGKVPPTRPTAREVGASPAREAPRASSKRPVVSPPEQVEDAGDWRRLSRPKSTRPSCGRSSRRQRERGEELLGREASEKELQVVRGHMGDAQQFLREARIRARRMDDELLQAVKDLESARAELPRQSIVQYKESLGFKEGLKMMGRVTYEYGYRVALARFRARHPNANVEEDPFTIHPEDDLVPMEMQQDFDDSVPPEP